MKIAVFIFTCLFAVASASEREALRFFENEIRPLLAENCYDCHDGEKQKGNLRLDHVSWMLKGGDSGPVVVAGRPAESLLIEVVKRLDPDFAMPPKVEKALQQTQIAKLEKWIKLGAPWPEDSNVEIAEETDANGFTAKDRAWWAIQPVADPKVPHRITPKAKEWAKNEIDYFVIDKLTESKLAPANQAGKEELVRRAYFDLHGLPPTPEAVAAFVEDQREDAFARLVDKLLESPRYGERWAQHWLDVVRYSESDGYRADGYRDGTWRYRDYVIRSLNQDKPYDQFVREQLAADELAPDDPDALIATAFLRLGIYEYNQRNAKMQWELIMTEMTNATAEAFLGIGIGCAQCHDHKFDPILQKDHFALQAFLNTTWWPENHEMGTAEEKAKAAKQLAEWRAATVDLRTKLTALQKPTVVGKEKGVVKQFPEDVQKVYLKPAGERTAYEEQLAQLVQRQVDWSLKGVKWEKTFEKKKESLEQYRELVKGLSAFDHLKPARLPLGFISTDVMQQPAQTFLAKRTGKEEVEPAFLTLLGQPVPTIKPTEKTTGRRTALANWIASPANPLSTRVAVNRIWQRHFGTGIVPTPNDFGTLGEEPSHPELLDWLTTRFVQGGWKLKEMHRLIMKSATYQQTARREPAVTAKAEGTAVPALVDPENRLLWRFPPTRLDAEQVRDSMLVISGELVQRDRGGPAVDGSAANRSIFVKRKRNSPDKVLGGFDAPLGFASAPNRAQTTTPIQSLLLVNGEWAMKRSSALARRLLSGNKVPGAAEIFRAFQLVYGREPNPEEVEATLLFLKSQRGEASLRPVQIADKFPNETGLRPIDQLFGKAKGVELGAKALWLQPGSRFEQLHLADTKLNGDALTVEAVVSLDAIKSDASVNTLVSRWNGSGTSPGWAFGVTSAKSSYKPQSLIVQLTGKNAGGGTAYEVVASNISMPLRTPVYLAAVISAEKQTVTFHLKDLTDPYAKMQSVEVHHSITNTIQTPNSRLVAGGRDQKGHLWDGQIARLGLSDQSLGTGDLYFSSNEQVADFDFTAEDGEEPATGAVWHRRAMSSPLPSKELQAMTDFCHALFNSNEFLYLH